MIEFKLEERPDSNGIKVPTLIKRTVVGDNAAEDEWCTVQELDRLFECCNQRWGNNWNLEKLMVAVRECEFN